MTAAWEERLRWLGAADLPAMQVASAVAPAPSSLLSALPGATIETAWESLREYGLPTIEHEQFAPWPEVSIPGYLVVAVMGDYAAYVTKDSSVMAHDIEYHTMPLFVNSGILDFQFSAWRWLHLSQLIEQVYEEIVILDQVLQATPAILSAQDGCLHENWATSYWSQMLDSFIE